MSSRPETQRSTDTGEASVQSRRARVFEPDDPLLEDKKIRRLRLTELEHISEEQRDVYRALLKVFPESALSPGFLGQLRSVVQSHTSMDIDLWLHSTRVLRRNELRAVIPGVSCLVIVGLPPLSEKIIVELDLRFVYRAISSLLGGHTVEVDTHRPLTDIEQGVFTFIILKVIALFQGDVVDPEQLAVRLEDIRNDVRSTADILRSDEFWLCSSFKLNFDLDVGHARVLIPTSLARHVFNAGRHGGEAFSSRRREHIRGRMSRLQGVCTEAPIEIGSFELSKEELEALEPGDIVLLDESFVELQEGVLHGGGQMRIGLGNQGVFKGMLRESDSGRGELAFEITSFEIVAQPTEYDPHDEQGESAHPEEVMAEYEDRPDDHEEDEEDEEYDDVEYDESNDGDAALSMQREDQQDEDWGINDENHGDEEEYEEEEYDEYEDEEAPEQQEGEYPPDPQTHDGAPTEEADNLMEVEPLLGDIPVGVVVEIGRVQLTADEVITLRAGQLIELGRTPAEPVDLVVSGKLLARGELVEIGGSLGVKILSLAKDPHE